MKKVFNKGKILEEAIRKSGRSISYISRQSKIPLRTIYNYFDKEKIDNDKILTIGKVINHDFSNEIPELKAYIESPSTETALEQCQSEKQEITRKYIDLLEKYNVLLAKIQ